MDLLVGIRKNKEGTSLMVHWLKLSACTAGGMGSTPGWGTKILQATGCGQKSTKGAHGH